MANAWLRQSRNLCRLAMSAPIPRNSLKIALVVGGLLNLINHGHAFFGPEVVSKPHVLLNFIVPYCVASYSAARNIVDRNT